MHTGRFSAEKFTPVLNAVGETPAGAIHFRGQPFASREEALAAALGDLDMRTQINLLDKEDREHGRTLARSEVKKRLGSLAAGLQRVQKSLTDKDGELLSQMRDALVDAAVPAEDYARGPSPAAGSDVKVITHILEYVGGDTADAPELARRRDADKEASRRVDGPFVRFAEACLVLVGQPRTRYAIRAAARRGMT